MYHINILKNCQPAGAAVPQLDTRIDIQRTRSLRSTQSRLQLALPPIDNIALAHKDPEATNLTNILLVKSALVQANPGDETARISLSLLPLITDQETEQKLGGLWLLRAREDGCSLGPAHALVLLGVLNSPPVLRAIGSGESDRPRISCVVMGGRDNGSGGVGAPYPLDIVCLKGIKPLKAVAADYLSKEIQNGIIIVGVGEDQLSVPFRVSERCVVVGDLGFVQLCAVPKDTAEAICALCQILFEFMKEG